MLTDKHYYAFISHSTRDAKVALWLRDRLVSYNIPASVQREHRAPKRLRPVFIYQTDLAGSNLQDALQRELDDSQWLIVICSPEGAQSPYVNGEIEHFIETGRADKIIPFIVAGTPHAKNPEDECFPPALLKLAQEGTELRGINLEESIRQLGSKMGAVVNVVATMLGVRFDSMWDVYRKKQRRRMMIAAVCALVLCLAGLFAWDYTRPTYRCFADYVDRWGVPEGIIELTKEQQSHRHRMYLFEYRRIPFGEPNAYTWRVVKVSYVNSYRVPQEEDDNTRFPITQIQYDKEDGIVAQHVFADEKGHVKLRHMLSARNGVTATIADILSAKQTQGVGFAASNDYLNRKSTIVRYVYERDKNGYIIRKTYHANNDYNIHRSAISDADGIFGLRYSLDSVGRVIKMHYLDYAGGDCSKEGVAEITFRYDDRGNIREKAYFDIDGQPYPHWLGYAKVTCNYDESGNLIEEVSLGSDGQLCINRWGYAKETYRYDYRGYLTELTDYGIDGNPCLCDDGYAKITYLYDDRGNIKEKAYFDIYNQSCLNKRWNYAKVAYLYDDCRNQIEKAYFGIDGQPCLCEDGYAKITYLYDDRGNKIEEAYFGIDGQPCISIFGYAKMTFKYDDRGNELEWAYFSIDGQPYLCEGGGFAKITYKYDDRGNRIEDAYLGIDGQPCLAWWGSYAKYTQQYDDRGNAIEEAYFGIDGQPCIGDLGYSKATIQYDDRGNIIELACFGIDGTPRLCDYGWAKVISQYDDRGNQIEESYFGIDGQPCIRDLGYARYTCTYDNHRNEIERHYYGIDGQPCTLYDGYSWWTKKYDNRRNMIEASYFDTKGNLVVWYDKEADASYARKTFEYDEFGKMTKEIHYDTKGNIISK